jgi:glycosyltransferase involved in cell wall biosynthesis
VLGVRKHATGSGHRLSVIVSTYDWPGALDVVLRALSEQTDQSFEVVVADDGSGPKTRETVRAWQATFGKRLAYVWHEDSGFRKARVVNLATLRATGDHLLFIDGDCVPRVGLVAALRGAAFPGWFLSTKRVHLDQTLTASVLEGSLPIWRWSLAAWMLRGCGDIRRSELLAQLRDRRRPWQVGLPDFAPGDNGYGAFLFVSREDLERVDGWDMQFTGWGSEDTDLVLRLRRVGLRCGWLGPQTTLFHFWHPKAEVEGVASFARNEQLVRDVQATRRVEAIRGLSELRTTTSSPG